MKRSPGAPGPGGCLAAGTRGTVAGRLTLCRFNTWQDGFRWLVSAARFLDFGLDGCPQLFDVRTLRGFGTD